jgi:hypothetical protein
MFLVRVHVGVLGLKVVPNRGKELVQPSVHPVALAVSEAS